MDFLEFYPKSPPIRVYRGTHAFSFSSRQIAKDLAKWGVVPRKSFIAEIKSDEVLYSRHAWRGIIDGDGWLGYKRSHGGRYVYPKIGLGSGSKKLMEQYLEFLAFHRVDHKANICETKRGHFMIEHSNTPAIQIVKLLYSRASVYLDRKKALADELVSVYG